MRVIAKKRLREFWEAHPDSAGPLKAWHAEARRAAWGNPAEVRAMYGSADVVGDNRMVNNVGGNKYRLVVHFHYAYAIARIKFIGTHEEYDAIDPATV